MPDRSFYVLGRQLPLCSRCSGLLVGYAVGLVFLVLGFSVGLWLIFAMTVPLIIDGYGQLHGLWISNNPRRFFTGIGFGVGLILIFKSIASLGLEHGEALRLFLLG